jgi:hypothetical protein
MEKLILSPEQSANLGLAERESLRVLSAGSRTILLERIQGDAENALPWDRDLVLSADVRSFPLADILNLLHASSKSGFLFFEDGDHAKSVYLHRGEVVFASSNQRFDRLGESLVRSGAITPDQYAEATQAYSATSQFGKILVEKGFLTSRELWNGVKLQVEEIVRSLFAYDLGAVLFWEGEIRPDNVLRLSLPSRRLIAQGLKRRDDLIRFLAWLESPGLRVEAVEGVEHRLAGIEQTMFEAIQAGGTFHEQCHRAGVEPLCGARIVQHLRLLDALNLTRAGDSSGLPERDVAVGDDESVRASITRYLKILAELAAPIVAVEGEQGIRERFAQVVEDAAQRYPELLSELEVGHGAALDPEDLIRRALSYPGDREREVRLALDELVSYLEFELINHPRIARPEDYLEGLETLRAGI